MKATTPGRRLLNDLPTRTQRGKSLLKQGDLEVAEGQSLLERGEYGQANTQFGKATANFERAREAGQPVAETPTVDPLRNGALEAQRKMREKRELCLKSASYRKPFFEYGEKQKKLGDAALTKKDYGLATKKYNDAIVFYKSAITKQ